MAQPRPPRMPAKFECGRGSSCVGPCRWTKQREGSKFKGGLCLPLEVANASWPTHIFKPPLSGLLVLSRPGGGIQAAEPSGFSTNDRQYRLWGPCIGSARPQSAAGGDKQPRRTRGKPDAFGELVMNAKTGAVDEPSRAPSFCVLNCGPQPRERAEATEVLLPKNYSLAGAMA